MRKWWHFFERVSLSNVLVYLLFPCHYPSDPILGYICSHSLIESQLWMILISFLGKGWACSTHGWDGSTLGSTKFSNVDLVVGHFCCCVLSYLWVAVILALWFPLDLTIYSFFSKHPSEYKSLVKRHKHSEDDHLVGESSRKNHFFHNPWVVKKPYHTI